MTWTLVYSDVSGVVNSDVYDYVGHVSGDVIADVPRMAQIAVI